MQVNELYRYKDFYIDTTLLLTFSGNYAILYENDTTTKGGFL